MKKLMAIAASALSLTMLAGCTPSGGTAMVVNGVAIPDSRINEWTDACYTTLIGDSGAATRGQLQRKVLIWALVGEMSKQYAEATNVTFDDADVRARIQQTPLAGVLEDPVCTEVVTGAVHHDLLMRSLGPNAAAYIGAMDVTMNPRYGEFDLQRNGFSSGSLAAQLR